MRSNLNIFSSSNWKISLICESIFIPHKWDLYTGKILNREFWVSTHVKMETSEKIDQVIRVRNDFFFWKKTAYHT